MIPLVLALYFGKRLRFYAKKHTTRRSAEHDFRLYIILHTSGPPTVVSTFRFSVDHVYHKCVLLGTSRCAKALSDSMHAWHVCGLALALNATVPERCILSFSACIVFRVSFFVPAVFKDAFEKREPEGRIVYSEIWSFFFFFCREHSGSSFCLKEWPGLWCRHLSPATAMRCC